MKLPLTLALALVGLAACGGSGDPPKGQSGERVFRTAGSLQCEGGGTSLPDAQAELTGAGVTVLGASCGLDGLGHPAVCGASDGAIHIFDVPPAQLPMAEALGFAPLSRLPDSSVTACR